VNQFIGYLALGVTAGFVYALLALGMVLIYKGTRTINFAHPYFGLICAFLCWWLTYRSSFPPFSWLPFALGSRPRFAVAVVLSLALVALNAYGLEHSIFRRLRGAPRLVVLVATIAVAQGQVGLVALLFNRTTVQATTFRTLPSFFDVSFKVGSRYVTGNDVNVLVVTLVLGAAGAAFFKFSKFGVAIRAAAENGDAARLLGISVNKVSTFVWVVGTLLAGIAGILITEVTGTLNVGTLSIGFLVRGLTAALVGGLTSLPGAVVGGLAVGVSEALLKWQFSETRGAPEILLFVLILIVLIFRPGGLFGQREETEDKVAFVPTIRDLPRRLQGTIAARSVQVLTAMLVVFACVAGLFGGSKTVGILILVTVYAMVGVSLTVLMGYTGQISLGHWGLAGLGAFTAANLYSRLHVPYLITLPLTVMVGMLVSLLIGLPALRIRGLYLAVVTLAFNVACEIFLFKTHLIGGSSAGIIVKAPEYGPIDLNDRSHRPLFLFGVLLLGLSLLVARNLARGRTGRGFFALRENEKAAATMGVGLTRYKLLSFAVSGGIAALAGALFVTYLGFAESTTWITATSLVLVSMVMIGGLGSLSGAVLGAFVVFGLPRLIELNNPWIVPIGTGALLLIVIVRAPGGLSGLVQRIRLSLVTGLHNMSEHGAPPSTPSVVPSP
jgi:ABC-type branched-subunit amino acid transport system permease subunit